MATTETRLFLYDHPVSSYAQKVRIALREKNIPFDGAVPAKLGTGQNNADLHNPRQEVPVLVVEGGTSIFDSTIILEYLEEKYPKPALLPRDPVARARTRMIEEICDTHYEGINWGYTEVIWFGRGEEQLVADKLKETAEKHTRQMQTWLERELGDADFFNGTTFGWADCVVAPFLNRSVFYEFGPAQESPLQKWHARVSERPSVKETFAEFDVAVAGMAGMRDAFKSGERKREYRDHRLEWIIKAGGISVVESGLRDRNIRFSWPGSEPPQR